MQANLLKQVHAKSTSRNRNAMTFDREQDNWGDKRERKPARVREMERSPITFE